MSGSLFKKSKNLVSKALICIVHCLVVAEFFKCLGSLRTLGHYFIPPISVLIKRLLTPLQWMSARKRKRKARWMDIYGTRMKNPTSLSPKSGHSLLSKLEARTLSSEYPERKYGCQRKISRSELVRRMFFLHLLFLEVPNFRCCCTLHSLCYL